MKEMIRSARLGEQYTKIEHSSGLTMLLYPMQGFSSAFAIFATKYGSVDNRFKTDADDDFVDVPEGIAHFLEHKLFESEDGDAFSRYAKTGANANAYTSFDRTAYLFSCSDHFEQSIEILLDFVTKPYFTPETVRKEQGIIGQEIKMYEDNPDWRVYFNLLKALYHNHPLSVDIVGTVESIARINADLLYRCYRTFYNLGNMVLAVAGNFPVDSVLAAADRILKAAPAQTIVPGSYDEPRGIRQRRVEQILPVAQPLFQIGFKGVAQPGPGNIRGQLADEMLLEILAGESSPLYRRLFDEGLINQTFSPEAMVSRDYALAGYSGESRDPDRVFDALLEEIRRVQRDGIDRALFERVKKMLYGRYVGAYGKVESVASYLVTTHFAGVGLYELLDMAASLTAEELAARLPDSFSTEHCALSVVKGS